MTQPVTSELLYTLATNACPLLTHTTIYPSLEHASWNTKRAILYCYCTAILYRDHHLLNHTSDYHTLHEMPDLGIS